MGLMWFIILGVVLNIVNNLGALLLLCLLNFLFHIFFDLLWMGNEIEGMKN